MSSATAVRPKSQRIISEYLLSYDTSSEAMLTKPYWSSSPCSERTLPLIAVIGKNVALPARCSFKKPMARFASVSLSTTMFCTAAPRAVSIAAEYLSLTVMS